MRGTAMWVAWTLGVLAALVGSVSAWAGDGAKLDVKLERTIVFKDGHGMFVKKVTGNTDRAGNAVIEEIPKAVILGSFWATPSKGALRSMVARQRLVPKQGRNETQKRLLLEFDPATTKDGVELDLFHFGPGIRWIPTYRVALRKDGKASLHMQAELLNEAADLEGVPVDLVVGVPSFRFKNCVSPICLEASLTDPLRRVAPQIMGQRMSNVLFTQRSGEVRGRRRTPQPAAAGMVPALPPELAAEGAHDLFVYHLPKLTLRTGERAAVPIFSADVPCRHLYTWDLHLTHTGTEALPKVGKHASPIRLLKNEVWHQIELTNTTDVPWTTGAALMMDGYLPIGQELLTYTSVGGNVQVPITVAIDVRGTYAEETVERKPKALRSRGYDHALMSKKGTLRVTNHKKEPITLLINCQFGGNATRASDTGKIAITDYQSADWKNVSTHPALNGHSAVRWQLKLKAGETKELTCHYEYYVRM